MLKKLYKHEFYSLLRNMLPIYAGLLGLALLSRISNLFKAENILGQFIRNSTTTLYVIGIFAMLVVGFVLIVTRFYKNLLSHEGYLTFTLPFKASNHLNCKIICGVCVMVINIFAVLASLAILGAGTATMAEIVDAVKQVWENLRTELSVGSFVLVLVEGLLAVLAYIAEFLLMLYASMAIGQQFKNRIGGAVVAYLCLYAATQTINLFVMLPVMLVNGADLSTWFNDPMVAVQVLMAAFVGYILVWAAVYYGITRFMLTRKLNLE